LKIGLLALPETVAMVIGRAFRLLGKTEAVEKSEGSFQMSRENPVTTIVQTNRSEKSDGRPKRPSKLSI
jgi:hypothetical protein